MFYHVSKMLPDNRSIFHREVTLFICSSILLVLSILPLDYCFHQLVLHFSLLFTTRIRKWSWIDQQTISMKIRGSPCTRHQRTRLIRWLWVDIQSHLRRVRQVQLDFLVYSRIDQWMTSSLFLQKNSSPLAAATLETDLA